MNREIHDDGWTSENRTMTEAIPLLATKCSECGAVHLLAVHASLKAEDILQARWTAGMASKRNGLAQLTHGGWLCWDCVERHADHALREAAATVREGHLRMRVDASMKAQTWRGRP